MRTFKYIYIIGIVAVLAIVGCGRGTGEKGLTHEEVRAINEQVLEKAIGQPDSALMMIERLRAGDLSAIDTTEASLQWSGPLPDYRCDYLRAKVYAQTLEGMWLDSAIIIGERLMTTDAAREDLAYRQDVLEMLISACRQHRDDELTIHWCTQLMELCRQNGDETDALRTEAEIALMLSGIGRADEGLAKIDSVIALLSGNRKFNELDATIIALKRKVNILKNSLAQQTHPQQTHPRPLPAREGSGHTQGQDTNEVQADELSTPLPHREGAGESLQGLSGEAAIIAAAQQMLDLMADYEQHPDEYHDGTYREPPEHLRPGYIDFYRAQAYMFMVESLTPQPQQTHPQQTHPQQTHPQQTHPQQTHPQQTHPQPLPVREGSGHTQGLDTNEVQADELSTPLPHREGSGVGLALHYLSLFEQTNYAKTFSARKDMAPTYGLLGMYDKMLAIHDEQEARLRQQGDTVCAEYATILRDRAMAAEAQGRNAEAIRLHHAYETLTAILNDRLLQGKAHLYAARFHAAEQQREIERHKSTSRYLSIVGSGIAAVAVLTLLFAAYVVHKRRIVDQKNRALVKQIAEAAEYRKIYEEAQQAQQTQQTHPQPLPVREGSGYTQDEDEAEGLSTPLPCREGPEESLLHIIKEKELYLDPHFDRQAAIAYFHLTKERIGAVFAQGSEYAKITDYINSLRLDHACELLTSRPDMSIDDVATVSGFALRRTFSRLFKDKFGLTPTEFREAASAEDKLA